MRQYFTFFFGFQTPVTQQSYLFSGVLLMGLKFIVESVMLYLGGEDILSPQKFFFPISYAKEAADWFTITQSILSIPFMWIALCLSVKRAWSAGISPLWGLLVLTPLVNYLVMVVLVALPDNKTKVCTLEESLIPVWKCMIFGVGTGITVATIAGLLAYTGLATYSTALFLSIPAVMGAVFSFLARSRSQVTLGTVLAAALGMSASALVVLLLIALEGAICILMASPLIIASVLAGTITGWHMAGLPLHTQSRSLRVDVISACAVICTMLLFSSYHSPPGVRSVHTSIIVDAGIEEIWDLVVAFPPLEEPHSLLFRAGIAYPTRAKIEGHGVGAIRYCEFSTGSFVEPITTWNPPYHLAFNVKSQPETMKELSPWGHISPHHLTTIPRSKKGQFKLKQLNDGRVKLTGTTWYVMEMSPTSYWAFFSDYIIGAIHHRVLSHIQCKAEKTC